MVMVISFPRGKVLRLRLLIALPSCPLFAIMVCCFDTEKSVMEMVRCFVPQRKRNLNSELLVTYGYYCLNILKLWDLWYVSDWHKLYQVYRLKIIICSIIITVLWRLLSELSSFSMWLRGINFIIGYKNVLAVFFM